MAVARIRVQHVLDFHALFGSMPDIVPRPVCHKGYPEPLDDEISIGTVFFADEGDPQSVAA
jgi:hypothetical protein